MCVCVCVCVCVLKLQLPDNHLIKKSFVCFRHEK